MAVQLLFVVVCDSSITVLWLFSSCVWVFNGCSVAICGFSVLVLLLFVAIQLLSLALQWLFVAVYGCLSLFVCGCSIAVCGSYSRERRSDAPKYKFVDVNEVHIVKNKNHRGGKMRC